jgi:hypothetical protein
MRVKRDELEHHSDVPFADAQLVDDASVERDRAFGNAFEPGDAAERRPLAATGRSQKDDEFATSDLEVDTLERVVADRNSRQKHVWRAQIILATAAGCGTAEIMRRAGVSKPSVWRWQARFMQDGVASLLRDKTRKPGVAPLPPALVDRLVALTLGEPPGARSHWTGRAMAAATGISLRSVQRIWAAHVRRFKLSKDPAFAAKLRDVVGLYLDPPARTASCSRSTRSPRSRRSTGRSPGCR